MLGLLKFLFKTIFYIFFTLFLLWGLWFTNIWITWSSAPDPSAWNPNATFVDPGLKYSFVKTNGIQLNVGEAGPQDGPLLIFLHGFPSSGILSWYKQIPHFVNEGYHVIVPDLRGYNTSDKPEGFTNYAIDILEQDVLGLAAHYTKQKFYLVGHDWGAVIVWHIAHSHPDLIHKAVVLNVPYPATLGDVIGTHPEQILNSWYIFFFWTPVLPEIKLSANNFAVAKKLLAISSNEGHTFSAEEAEMHARKSAIPGELTGMLNWYRAILAPSALRKTQTIKDSPNIKVPVLIIWGDHDVALISAFAPASFAYCPAGSKLVFAPGASHWVMLDEPELVNNEISEFLK